MTYIYDIVVNFVDGDRLIEFFEWDRRDIVEHIRKIPLIRVNDDCFFDFISNRVVVSLEFLNLIKGKASFFSENRSDYVALISNGKKAYAFEFGNDGSILCRSSLLIDEEDEILSIAKRLDVTSICYNVVGFCEYIYKFTRKEEKNKILVFKEIESAYRQRDKEKLSYMYYECVDDLCDDLNNLYNKLLNCLDNDLYLKKLFYIFKLLHKNEKYS